MTHQNVSASTESKTSLGTLLISYVSTSSSIENKSHSKESVDHGGKRTC